MLTDPSTEHRPEPLAVPHVRESVNKLLTAAPTGTTPRQKCPYCGSVAARRVRALTFWDRWRRAISAKRLFRCGQCKRRCWMTPTTLPAEWLDVGPVDLEALDVSMRRDSRAKSFGE
jgi:DNA-directed RNA polymerase subunit RPC12/RpoP